MRAFFDRRDVWAAIGTVAGTAMGVKASVLVGLVAELVMFIL